jgi:hypothetical protein
VPTNPSRNSPEALWRSQNEETPVMTLADIRRKAQAFQTKIRRRNVREYTGAALGMILFGTFMWIFPGLLTKLGAGLTMLAIVFVVYQMRRDGSARDVPADATAADCLTFHRQELARQRDLLKRVGPWQQGPMVPGVALFFAGLWLEYVHDREDAVIMTISAILMAAVFGVVHWLNARAARQLQRDLELLAD